jgi:drug/metabolite transporter (DMT)-like permease
LYYGLLRDVGSTTLSMVTYVTPVFATVAGVVVLNETLTWYQPVGAAIVLGAVWFAERQGGSQRIEPPVEATP